MAQRQVTVMPPMNVLATTRSAQIVSRAAATNAGNQLSSQQIQNIEGRSNNNSYHEQYEEQGEWFQGQQSRTPGINYRIKVKILKVVQIIIPIMNKMRRKLSV